MSNDAATTPVDAHQALDHLDIPTATDDQQVPGHGAEFPPASSEQIRESRLLLRINDAAQLLGVGRTKVYELIASGDLIAVRIGRSSRLPQRDVEEYVERLRQQAYRDRSRMRSA